MWTEPETEGFSGYESVRGQEVNDWKTVSYSHSMSSKLPPHPLHTEDEWYVMLCLLAFPFLKAPTRDTIPQFLLHLHSPDIIYLIKYQPQLCYKSSLNTTRYKAHIKAQFKDLAVEKKMNGSSKRSSKAV